MYRKSILALSVTAAVALGAVGCGAGGGTTDTINMSLNTDPATFDPALAKGGDDFTVARLLFDTVVRKDAGNTLAGGIASSWTAEDAAHYTLTIRSGLNCSDGSPITPTVVAASLTRFAAKETSSSGRTLALGGATATFTPDDKAGTVKAELSAPWSDFLTGLTLPQAGIVCPAGLKDTKGLAAGKVAGAFSGPYSLTASQPAVSYQLSLREGYAAWPKFAKPLTGEAAKQVILTPITDYATIATQLLAGSLDVGTVSDENVARFDGNKGFTSSVASNTTTYLLFNERPGTVFADKPELRTAVAQAIDAQAFSDIISGKRGSTILSVGSAKLACVNTDKSLLVAQDAAAAGKKLTGVRFRIVGTTLLQSGNDYIAEALRNAGATVTVDSLDNANWATLTTAGGKDWDINVQGDNNQLGVLTSSLLRVMGPATEDGGRNKTGEPNKEGYGFVTKAMSEIDRNAQCSALQSAQKSFLERVDAIPLATLPATTVAAAGFDIRTFDDYLDPATLRIVK
ncbi:ABC transporter substrate-binding protein [Nonomuraea sp. NPDC050022]|uniref:ABC transporter substrate-binding protein n=1 Tax=unclassified Nonomuraea TaxID=2593643 RepID=UPI0033CE2E12